MTAPTDGVLAGIRVLDFGRYIAGPHCAALLGDLGADVIRIERPGGGEDRGVAPVTEAAIPAICPTGSRASAFRLPSVSPAMKNTLVVQMT